MRESEEVSKCTATPSTPYINATYVNVHQHEMQSKTQHRVTLATLQALSSPTRLFPSSQKVRLDRLIQTPASVTHHRQTRRIAGTLRHSDREGHLTMTESAESLPDVQGIQIRRGKRRFWRE